MRRSPWSDWVKRRAQDKGNGVWREGQALGSQPTRGAEQVDTPTGSVLAPP